MKALRILLGAALLVAACDTGEPVSPPPGPRYDGALGGVAPQDTAQSSLCDSACIESRSPQLGSSGG